MRKGEVYTGFWWGKPEGRIPLARPRLIWGIILKWIFKTGDGNTMDWIDPAQDMGRCRASELW